MNQTESGRERFLWGKRQRAIRKNGDEEGLNRIIEVGDLSKSYGRVRAVRGISFYVEEGRLFAFLGPNGAGKSTTIDIISTFLKPDAGTVTIDGLLLGKEDAAIRSVIGVVFQEHLMDPLLTVEENLRVRGGFYALERKALSAAVDRAVKAVGAEEYRKRLYGKLSGGQRRRTDIARALVNTPKVLFLDEPTTGLDPQTRKNVWETIRTLQRETGMTVFMTTHYMEEAAQADYVIIIDKGVIAAKGTPTELKTAYASELLKLTAADEEMLVGFLHANGISFERSSEQFVIRLQTSLDSLPLLEKSRPYLSGFEVLHGTMDDAFIAITGKEMRE
jgi:multidrug/hemolysin transport system ATP-binding protein